MNQAQAIQYLWLIPFFPLLGSLLNGFLALRYAHREQGPPRALVGLIGVSASSMSFLVTLIAFLALRGLPVESRALGQHLFTWMQAGSLRIELSFLFDPLSSAMLLFVTGIGSLIHLYSIGYMAHDRGVARYFSYLNLFMFAMILLVLGDSLPVLFIGWEGVGLCSYLLIGFWHEDPEKAKAGMKAFVVNRIGDFGFLLGMFLIFWTLTHGSSVDWSQRPALSFAAIAEACRAAAHGGAAVFSPAVATAVCLLLFLGACGKSAQIPLYIWLPDAMAGPTPVSALIHAATMVTSGVYMVARLNFLYVLSPMALTVMAIVGTATALVAATIGLTQFDIKKVLAYSTVSQLGYMFLGVSTGVFAAGLFHVVTHAFFKALLFLGAGSVIHALSGEQDIRKMGGLFRKIPITAWTFLIAWLGICGIAPLAGFFSKDEILARVFAQQNPILPWLPKLLWLLALLAAGITALYMTRLVVLTFFGSSRVEEKAAHHIHESPRTMTVPLVILAAGTVLVGFLGAPNFLGEIMGLGPNRFEHWCAPVFEQEIAGGGGESAAGVSGAPGSELIGETAAAAAAGGAAAHGGLGPQHLSIGMEWGLMGAALGLALLAIWIGWTIYAKRPQAAVSVARSFGGLYRLARDKYRVDEAYDAAIVRPLVWSSRRIFFEIIDVKVIDFSVNLVGILSRLGSFMVRFVQTGTVQAYALVLLLGLLGVLLLGR